LGIILERIAGEEEGKTGKLRMSSSPPYIGLLSVASI
jgi:hypothetical protein